MDHKLLESCCDQGPSWVQNAVENLLFPFLVAATTYVVITKLDEWKKRRSYSKLGAVIVESLIEEVKTGMEILNDAQNPAKTSTNPLPKKSWNGMTTIPDDVLLRIIEVSENVIPRGFPPIEIMSHCKNYFEFITFNWESNVLVNGGANWKAIAVEFSKGYTPAVQNVLSMLVQTKELLIANSKKWMPK